MSSNGFLTNTWYAAFWSHELTPGSVRTRRILGNSILVMRTASGALGALADRCPHRLVPLSMGTVVGERLQCSYHGLEFDLEGRCAFNPHGSGATPSALNVARFAVEERHSVVWLWIGDDKADPASIPDLGFIGGAEARCISDLDYLHVKANWRSIMDNLMDLSHTSYVHRGILGDPETAMAKVRVEGNDRCIRVHREPVEAATPSFFVPLLGAHRARMMKWNEVTWSPPATVIVKSGVFEPGSSPTEGTGFWGVHLLSPETANTTHYLFGSVRWNPQSDPSRDAEIRKALSEATRFAFQEQDLPVVEAQQKVLDEIGDAAAPVLLGSIDDGPARVQRAISRRLKESGH